MKKTLTGFCLVGAVFLLAAGCTLGPDYRRPEVEIPIAFREEAPWKPAAPADALSRGEWWTIFDDPVLDRLQEQLRAANQEVRAAVARLDQARAAARIRRADLVPRLDLDPALRRQRIPADLAGGSSVTATTLQVPFDLSYEVDLWGRVRRSAEAATAEYRASASDLEGILLTLQAEAARDYFLLRSLDQEVDLLESTVTLRRENLRMVESLFRSGQVGRLDVARAETELATAEGEVAAVRRQATLIEHALAVLVGENVSGFRLPSSPPVLQPPAVGPGLPSQLLERRPDVAAAERRLQAANARIGVAQAAFFPAISLTGSAGFSSSDLSSLFAWDNRTWALGPAVSLPIFSGGRNRAGLEAARARYEETVADYRQSVLVAFREVEDALSDLRNLADQAAAQERAVGAAREAADLSGKRYRAGLVSYLEVVDSERTSLASQRLAVQILGLRLQASVSLIKALGGGWESPLSRVDSGRLAQRF